MEQRTASGNDSTASTTTDVAGTEAGAVGRGEATGKTEGVKPATTTSKKRAGTRRRKTQSRTVEGNTDTMNVSTLPEQSTQVPPAAGEVPGDAQLNEERAAQQLGVSPRALWTCRSASPRLSMRSSSTNSALSAPARAARTA